jgi:alpha-N-arabinofuranosidase
MKAAVWIDRNNTISPIDERIYGSFIEHMGRAVYTGIYEPDHPSANEHGFRQDVIDLIKPLNIPVIRYPGGNFVSGYRWEDGVGPKDMRPTRPDLAWFALETNQVGIGEFMDFLRHVGVAPMIAVNLGTRGPQDAANLLEYCNFPGGTYYSDMRIAHGYAEPHNIKLWCLGNEMDGPWQVCAKTADEYGRVACETAKMMKWLDPAIELVVCGSSFREMPTFGDWERTVLRHTYEHVDYLSLHTYYTNMEGDVPSFLANSVRMGSFIEEVAAICAEIKAEKRSDKNIYLSFDEWNVWYHFRKEGKEPPKWIFARPIEEEVYDFADALLVGSMLITLINHSDVVRIACLAQLVNTIAPIMTEPGGRSWVQTTYYPFLYTSRHGRGTALSAQVQSPAYSCAAGDNIPYIDCAAVASENANEIALFIVNKHLEEDIACTISLSGLECRGLLEWISLHGYSLTDTNTTERSPVQPVHIDSAVIQKHGCTLTLPKASWNMLRLEIKP